MPAVLDLTRRLLDDRSESWGVYFADVRVGQIGRRAGVPLWVDQWAWSCGFYPGCGPGQHTTGTAPNFEEARAGFQISWVRLHEVLTDSMLDEWRHARDFTAWKYAMWDAGCRMPAQNRNLISTCFCGAIVSAADAPEHVNDFHSRR